MPFFRGNILLNVKSSEDFYQPKVVFDIDPFIDLNRNKANVLICKKVALFSYQEYEVIIRELNH